MVVFGEEVVVRVGFGLVALSPVPRGVVVVGVVVVGVVVVGVIGVAVVVVGVVVVGPAASEAAPGVAWWGVVVLVDGSLSLGLLPPLVGLSGFNADAGADHLQDDGVVDEAIDRSRGRHRVLQVAAHRRVRQLDGACARAWCAGMPAR